MGNIIKKRLMPYAYETNPHISLTCKLVPVLNRKFENVSIWRYAPSSISALSDTAYGQITSQSEKLPVLLKSRTFRDLRPNHFIKDCLISLITNYVNIPFTTDIT